MEVDNLQYYLNWLIYLQRCKKDDETWPKTIRILSIKIVSHIWLTINVNDSELFIHKKLFSAP